MRMVVRGIGFAMTGWTVAALVAGCSADTAADAGPDVCDQVYEIFSVRSESCAAQPFGDKERFLTRCHARTALTGVAIDQAYVDACSAAIVDLDCATNIASVEECSTPAGTLTTDDACSANEQCDSLKCTGVVTEKSGALTCGVCAVAKAAKTVKKLKEGAVCDPLSTTSVCGSKLFCDAVTGTCVKQLAKGSACAFGSQCASGLGCIDLKCSTLKGEGSECLNTTDCAVGLGCDHESQKCAVRAYTVAPGATCDLDTRACAKGTCNMDGLSIGSTELKGVCPAIVSDGSRCDLTDPSTVCDSFADCVENKCKLRTSLACDVASE